MDYTTAGFTDNLIRQELADPYQQLDPQAFDQFTPDVSGSKISNGVIRSRNGNVILDLENDVLKVSDGIVDRIKMGKLDDGTIGLIVQDKDGNILLQISEGANVFQSADKSFVIDAANSQFIVYEGTTPRIILGKFVGLF